MVTFEDSLYNDSVAIDADNKKVPFSNIAP